MKFKICFALVFSFFVVASGCGVALAQEVVVDGVVVEVTAAPGITPANPFHVFERWGDWMRLNALTFNAVRKAEVQSQIAEKRLSELKAMVESGADSAVMNRAETFYKKELETVQ